MYQIFLFIFLFTLLMGNTASTQNYNPVPTGRDIQYYHVEPSWFQDTFIVSLHIDSSKVLGTDTVLFPYRVVDGDGDSLGWNCEYNAHDTSWAGHRIIQRPGQTIFFNRQNDSIKINYASQLNDSWKLFELENGGFIEATFYAFGSTIIFGAPDSLKYITCQAKDSNGINISNTFNGKNFILSKNYGFWETYNFNKFPEDTTSYHIIGISNPDFGVVNITARDIFNYDAGDEFHHHKDHRDCGPSYCRTYENYFILKVIAKKESANLDTITYTYEKCYLEYNYDGDIGFDTIRSQTIATKKIILSRLDHLNPYPFELAYEWFSRAGFNELKSGYARTVKSNMQEYEYNSSEGCLFYPLSTGSENPRVYGDGIGLVKYRQWYGDFYESTFDLVYYKKGNETWGNPLDCNKLLLRTAVATPDESIKLFPNPAGNTINILLPKSLIQDFGTLDFTLFDILGREVMSSEVTLQLSAISIETQFSGLYFYEIRVSSYLLDNGKLIIQ
ncbi:MAG: T9SS type A sorting domain-containing protein [Bacteroidetes bacterium]|nr:T9SS type A sorting domain-containing protein [Bacteroidota bacterium]